MEIDGQVSDAAPPILPIFRIALVDATLSGMGMPTCLTNAAAVAAMSREMLNG